MSTESALESISERLEKVEDSTKRQEQPKAVNPSMIIFRFVQIFGIIFIFSLFLKYEILSYFVEIQSMIFNLFLSMNLALVQAYSVFAIVITFLIYFNIIWYFMISSLFLGFDKSFENFSRSFQKYQSTILIIMVIIFAIDFSFLEGETYNSLEDFDFRSNWDDESINQQSKFDIWLEKTSCSFNPSCILEQKNVNQVDTVSSTSYKFNLNQEDIFSSYQEQYLKEFPIPYEVEAKGNSIILDKLECYKSNKNEENLISSKELNGRVIQYENRRIIDGLSCDLSSLANEENYNEQVKIYPILYYSINTDFSQEIPFVDMNEYKLNFPGKEEYEIRNEIFSEFKLPEGLTTSDILEIEPVINPKPPIILGDENFPTTMIFQIRFRAQSSSLGSVTKTTVLDMQYPQTYLSSTSKPTFPIMLGTSKGESTLSLPFTINTQSSLQGSEIIREDIKFRIETQMKLDREFFEFTLLQNPNNQRN